MGASGLAALVKSVRDKGAWPTAVRGGRWIKARILPRESPYRLIAEHRVKLANSLMRKLGPTVRYGPFRGMKLASESSWSAADKATMLFGLYEKELTSAILAAPDRFDTFVDIGAADGYYSVGLLFCGRFRSTIAYEMSEPGERLIKELARLNGVSDALEVRGLAGPEFYREVPSEKLGRAVLLIDIEGAEFDILSKDVFRALSETMLFVEIHEWVDVDGRRLEALKSDAAETHDVETIVHGGRDMSQFDELRRVNENDLWLLCSEGRPYLMHWLKFSPKAVA